MDVVTLSRLQFAITIGFHYLFPPLSIGLGLLLVIMEGMYLRTRNQLYRHLTQFWVRIFGLIFALGVATGIVMEFQFGTNWSTYSRYVGDVFGSALAAEGIFAFFLESGFLAILLFGWNKVGPKLHFFSTLMVCLGAHFSAIWIVVANSWQQTPAGFRLAEHLGTVRAETSDFWQMVFNPSAVDRVWHVYMAAWQAGAFLVLSVGAWYLLKNKYHDFAKSSIKIGLVAAVIASVLQLVSGHSSANVVAQYQPAKLAAFEGHFEASAPADAYIFGWVDEQAETVSGVKIPGLLSYLISGSTSTPVTGLRSFAQDVRPPVNLTFQSYHAMVAIGFALIVVSLLGVWLWWRRTLFTARWYHWILVFSVLGPQAANQLGWMTAEVGRQPWVVYGLLRTEHSVSPSVTSGEVITSVAMFGIIYLLLGALFIFLLNDKIQHGPGDMHVEEGQRA